MFRWTRILAPCIADVVKPIISRERLLTRKVLHNYSNQILSFVKHDHYHYWQRQSFLRIAQTPLVARNMSDNRFSIDYAKRQVTMKEQEYFLYDKYIL